MNLTAHWELKLVALVIAVALWIYTSGQVRSERTLTVSVGESSVLGLGGDLVVSSIGPREFTVRLSVPNARLEELPASLSPRLSLPAGTARKGRASLPITGSLLSLPHDVRILDIKPEGVRDIQIGLDRIEELDLPVEPPALAGLPAGLDASLALDVTYVRVRAPVETLERLRSAQARQRFAPIQLDQEDPALASERIQLMQLTPLAEGCTVLTPVKATVTIRPVPLAKPATLVVPVEVLASRDLSEAFSIALDPPRVVLQVKGPENLVAGLRPEDDLVAFVRLHEGLAPGRPHPQVVTVLAPSWLGHEPVTVSVTLTPRPAGPERRE